MLNYEKFIDNKILEADLSATVHSTSPVPSPATVPAGKPIRLSDAIAQFQKKIEDKKNQSPSNINGQGVKLQRDVKFIIIDGENGEKYELTYVDTVNGKVQQDKTFPTYSIKTQDEKINKQSKNYIVLDDNTYNKIIEVSKKLENWKKLISSAPVNSSPVNSLQQSKITPEKFDSYLLSQFTNNAIFGKYEKFAEVAGILMGLKEKYPNLYNKSYSDFVKLMKNIIPESKKNKLITKWYIIKLNQDYNLETSQTGQELKKGDQIQFKNSAVKFTTPTIKIKNIAIKNQST